MRPKVLLLHRKKIIGRNSIEEVFSSLNGYLKYSSEKFVPEHRLTFAKFFRNAFFTFKNRGVVTHISGDVNYLTPFAGRKTILTIHDIESTLNESNFINRFLKLFLWFYMPAFFSSKISVISSFTKSQLEDIVPFAKNKIVVIPNPYNECIQHFPKAFNFKNPLILHIGTKPNKNLLRVVESLYGIRCRLFIIGKLSDEQLMYLHKYKISYINEFNINFEKVSEAYTQCDIVSFPSTYEGFGMPILEGNKAGRAVITSNICSMPEVAGTAACFVDPFSVYSIRSGFLRIINDEFYRDTLVENGIKNIERFSPQFIASLYNDLYDELLH